MLVHVLFVTKNDLVAGADNNKPKLTDLKQLPWEAALESTQTIYLGESTFQVLLNRYGYTQTSELAGLGSYLKSLSAGGN